MVRRRALVTNDDGISSEGIRVLARMAVDAGLEVVVAAPHEEASGSSASLRAVEAEGRILVEEHPLSGLPDVPAYGVRAAPGFIALIGARRAFGPTPDVVLSGVNRGVNTGHAILHSGTVGAAFTAATQGCPALAVSLAVSDDDPQLHWETAAEVAARVLPAVLEDDQSLVLNVNVPNVEPASLRGLGRGRLASFGAVQTNVAEVGRGYVRIAVAEPDAEMERGTDAWLVAHGYASLTALHPICEAAHRGVDALVTDAPVAPLR
jgi:5'-nucleotidase